MTDRRPLLLLIDGHALAFRAFHALSKQGLRTSRGEPTYAIFGFTSIMLTAIEQHRPEYVAVAFDVGRTFRDDLYAEYKAGRGEPPEEFEQQLARIKQLLEAFNIPIYTAEGYEADDVIGTLARQATALGVDTLILTGDTDTLQLVNEHVRVLLANPYGQKTTTTLYDVAKVAERYQGLRPDQLADLRGLKGDASDNIPGVKGIGEAGAIQLLKEFGTIEQLYENLALVPNRYKKALDGQREHALFSKRLATIVCDAPVVLDLRAATLRNYDRARVIALFQELEMGATLIKKLPPVGEAFELAELPSAGDGPTTEDPGPGSDDASTPQQLAMFDMASVPARPAAPTPPPPAHGAYVAMTSAEQLAEVVSALAAAPGFAFDTETSGERPLEAELVGISISVAPGHAWYIPIGHTEGEQLPAETVLRALAPFFGDAKLPKYAHNAKFDIEALEKAGVSVAGLAFDTMLAAALLDKRRGLKDLAFYELRLPEPLTGIEELIGRRGKGQLTFAQVPIERATPYAAADADMTLRLKEALEPQLAALPKVNEIFRRLEMPLVPVLVRMEQAGIKLDVPYMRALGERMGAQLAELERQIYAIAGTTFNINSGDQLAEVLFGPKINLPTSGLPRTSTGRYSLTAQVLEDLRQHDTSGILELILQHRRLSKLKSTYVDELPALVGSDGRVHTDYSQIGSATGRLASLHPNLMNIPTRTEEGREVRRGFIAEPGHTLIAADYSQIELRVLAHITQDENLVRTFVEDRDIHAATASQLFAVPEDQVSKNQRRVAKLVIFGIIYGISAFGLAPRIGTSREEAKRLIDDLFARFPGIRSYIDQTLEAGRRDGYVQSLFGRRRMMPDLRISGPRRQAAEREAINAPIQATAADIMKIAMIEVDAELRRRGLCTRMLLQVHDELILEAPDEEVAEVVALVRERMEGAFQLRVPLKVEAEAGPNWEELRPI
ncbi:MAG TPA: DNA polymerase I [Roseiflexaceae bacterium]|nr:DNA polymerase I [Roseiflexaceae bacterium]